MGQSVCGNRLELGAPNGCGEELPPRRELAYQQVLAELFIHEPEQGRIWFLNPTATVVWNCCDGRTSLRDCEARLRAAFSVPEGVDLIEDIREVLSDLQRKDLLHVPADPQ